jgi:hypothetical protein
MRQCAATGDAWPSEAKSPYAIWHFRRVLLFANNAAKFADLQRPEPIGKSPYFKGFFALARRSLELGAWFLGRSSMPVPQLSGL